MLKIDNFEVDNLGAADIEDVKISVLTNIDRMIGNAFEDGQTRRMLLTPEHDSKIAVMITITQGRCIDGIFYEGATQ